MLRTVRATLLCCLPLAAIAAETQSITTAPANAMIGVGEIRPYVATATFTDATTGRLGNATLAAGSNHTCALQADGTVQCWGENGFGQLGNFSTTDSPIPVTTSAAGKAVAVTAGWEHSCLLESDGTVRCWGRNDLGQVGNGTTAGQTSPVAVTGLGPSTAIALSGGFNHTCALFAGGTVQCWGSNNAGQLGNGTVVNATTPVAVSGITTAIAIASGGEHSCAALANGTVKCWGADGFGQLGNGAGGASTTPVDVAGLVDAVAVSAGFHHSCALIAGGSVMCWGRNLDGQLGDGFLANQPAPVTADTQPFGRMVAVSAGTSHTCAAAENGLSICWGDNGNGQLGLGTVVGRFPDPNAVYELGGTIAIAAGFAHSCALLRDGRVRCWGLNQPGQLGAGSPLARSGLPLTVSGTVLGVSAGGAFTCANTFTGAVDCWGSGALGRLGNGGTSDSNIPRQVDPFLGRDATSIALGFEHACMILPGGGVACWGGNGFGQLGGFSGNQVPFQLVPMPIGQADLFATALAAGAYHTCAIRSGATVRCWGRNNFGQIGNTLPVDQPTPTAVAGVTGAQRISAGQEHTCVVTTAGGVLCWGRGTEGQLGNNQGTSSASPVSAGNLTTATQVAAGDFHTCARITGGAVLCWGRNAEGQLGDGTNTPSNTPVFVSGITTAVNVSSGMGFSCALLSSGTVRCWGRGTNGELGNGGFAVSNVPVAVSNLTGAVAMDSGWTHTCVVRLGGVVQCWGDNLRGQLGDATNANSSTPATAVAGINVDAAALAWSSSDPSVATVDMSGRVLGVGVGETTIKAEYGGKVRNTLLTVALDTDADGVFDPLDNCLEAVNPDQRDTDGDGYGNLCDGDLNNSGLVTAIDFNLFRGVLNLAAGASALAAAADMNGSGLVTSTDFTLLRAQVNLPPGPSGLHPPQSFQ